MSSANRDFKNAIYEQLARVGKSLSSGPRLELLDLLCQGPRTVEALAEQAGQSVANTSHHLQVLRRARLVEGEKHGVRVTYRLADEQVAVLLRSLRQLAESRLFEVEQITRDFLQARGSLEPVDREALVARVRSGAVTVLDVRPTEEYRVGHIPGALSLPIAELEQRLDELPRDREIVAYCRGPYCVMSLEVVEALRKQGFTAARLEDSLTDWKARGFDIAVGETP